MIFPFQFLMGVFHQMYTSYHYKHVTLLNIPPEGRELLNIELPNEPRFHNYLIRIRAQEIQRIADRLVVQGEHGNLNELDLNPELLPIMVDLQVNPLFHLIPSLTTFVFGFTCFGVGILLGAGLLAKREF